MEKGLKGITLAIVQFAKSKVTAVSLMEKGLKEVFATHMIVGAGCYSSIPDGKGTERQVILLVTWLFIIVTAVSLMEKGLKGKLTYPVSLFQTLLQQYP